jgi:uncharacterized tellurite resistance protein B-like protein
MATWLGALRYTGVLSPQPAEAAGESVASYVVGSEAVAELKRWFDDVDPEVADRERFAAVEACILMAHADRSLQREERRMLLDIVGQSRLPEHDRRTLRELAERPGVLGPLAEGDLERRLTQPVLRELILALAWELALADDTIEASEASFFDELAERLDIAPERAAALRAAVGERLG